MKKASGNLAWLITPIYLSVALFNCKGKDGISEIRSYQVLREDINRDSIWIDTVYYNPEPVKEHGLSALIHAIDSTLTKSLSRSRFRNVSLDPDKEIYFRNYDLVSYHASVKIQQGTLSFYGIHLKGWGTVYWRWLDGRKTLLIQNSLSSTGQEREFNELGEFLDSLIYKAQSVDSSFNFSVDSVSIEMDTAILKSQGIRLN